MSARATQSPLTMPDIRLQALPYRQLYRPVSLFWGGVHIQRLGRSLGLLFGGPKNAQELLGYPVGEAQPCQPIALIEKFHLLHVLGSH